MHQRNRFRVGKPPILVNAALDRFTHLVEVGIVDVAGDLLKGLDCNLGSALVSRHRSSVEPGRGRGSNGGEKTSRGGGGHDTSLLGSAEVSAPHRVERRTT